jgi:hypothetical protein
VPLNLNGRIPTQSKSMAGMSVSDSTKSISKHDPI